MNEEERRNRIQAVDIQRKLKKENKIEKLDLEVQ